MPTIKIESILGGHAPTTHFGRADQFRASIGIDPSLPLDDSLNSANGSKPCGLLRPMSVSSIATTVGIPMWIEGNPKEEGKVYVYGSNGSSYTLNDTYTTLTSLSDAGTLSSSSGNGMAYYDNYMYFATNTDITRYGPLNGAAGFVVNYWTGTLGKAALVNTTYPVDFDFTISYPNHFLHRHSDGRLYIADVVGNQGTIHYISTTKGAVEGDTDNGSTASKLTVGYGLWPTAMESYGSDLVIAFIEIANASGTRTVKATRAKLAFWDTTSTSFNKIIWVEYPDQMITGLKNVNGILYVASGNQYAQGFRITRFVGGYTFEDVAFLETGQPPFPGAVDGTGDRLLFGSWASVPETSGSVYSYGLQKRLSKGIFNVAAVYGVDGSNAVTRNNVIVTALKIVDSSSGTLLQNYPIMGIGQPVNYHGVVKLGSYSGASVFWSQVYKVGQPAKIKKIRIPLAQPLTASMTITPKIYFDSNSPSTSPIALTTINSANFGINTQSIVIRPNNLTIDNDFWLELRWTGTALAVVALPITIEFEFLQVETSFP